MKVLAARVDPREGWDNPPRLELLVDRIPQLNEFRFRKKGPYYFAELDGFVEFFYYDGPGDGYGGNEFEITMEDGTREVLVGPWSSNSAAMARAGFPDTIPVSITDNPDAWERGYTFYSGHITVELAKAILREFKVGWDLMPVTEDVLPEATLSEEQARGMGWDIGKPARFWIPVKVEEIPPGWYHLVVALPYDMGKIWIESCHREGTRRVCLKLDVGPNGVLVHRDDRKIEVARRGSTK